MRQVALTTSKGGITRLRVKGAALQDSLYDLENGYITAARTIKMRPGTRRRDTLPAGTHGLVGFQGKLHVFSTTTVAGLPADYVLHELRSPDGSERTIAEIHFAEPFLGILYVAVEFDDGNVYHFWLRKAPEWEAETLYKHNALVSPITNPGPLVFRASRNGSPFPAWQAGRMRQVGDRIEPTRYNGFYYEVVEVNGDNPRSGDVEPIWPTVEGETVREFSDSDTASGGATPPSGGEPPPSSSDTGTGTDTGTGDRYSGNDSLDDDNIFFNER